MTRSHQLILAGALGLAVFGVLGTLSAQWAPFPGPQPFGPAQPGRFTVARWSGDNIILLDTATGDLYKATPADIKSYRDRPRVGGFPPPPPGFDKKEFEKKPPGKEPFEKKPFEKKPAVKDRAEKALPEKERGKAAPVNGVRSRVALVNLGHVLKNYEKVRIYNEALKKNVKLYQDKENNLKQQMDKLFRQMKRAGSGRERLEKEMKLLQQQREHDKKAFEKSMAKKQEEHLTALYKELRTVTGRHAKKHNLELVMHYIDHTDALYWSGPNLAQKLSARSLIPLYHANGVDISEEVVAALNAAYKGKDRAEARNARAPD